MCLGSIDPTDADACIQDLHDAVEECGNGFTSHSDHGHGGGGGVIDRGTDIGHGPGESHVPDNIG